jgi:type IV pilus assembly protein PilM
MQFGNRDVIGLDIGSYAVKLVQMRKSSKGWSIVAGAIAEVADKGPANQNQRETNVINAIQNCINLAGIKTNYAACALGGHEVAIRNFDFPVLPEDELETAILLEARQVCPFTTTDIAVDYHIIANGNDRTRGYLVAATNKQVNDITRLVKRAKLNCTLVDADALALLNCFTEIEKPGQEHGTAILNIGNNHTTMVIEGKSGWPLVRNLNYAAEEVIRQIAEEHSLTLENIRKILLDEAREMPPEIYESLTKVTGDFIRDIEKTLLYFSTQENSFAIQKILVCGGASLYKEIVKLLGSVLPVKIELWNPVDKIQCHGSTNAHGVLLKSVIKKNGPAMVVAAGLAMRSF